MPVTTRIINADSGSSRSVKFTLKSPEVIQVKIGWAIERDSGARATSSATARADTANDASMAPHAIAPATRVLTRRPKLALSRKPTNGRSGISSSIRCSPPRPRGIWPQSHRGMEPRRQAQGTLSVRRTEARHRFDGSACLAGRLAQPARSDGRTTESSPCSSIEPSSAAHVATRRPSNRHRASVTP